MFEIKLNEVKISEDRVRQYFSSEDIKMLAVDIVKNTLYNAPVLTQIDGEYYLVAGERRLRAITEIFSQNLSFSYNGTEFSAEENLIPFTLVSDISPADALEIELHENLLRDDLEWRQVILAKVKLHTFRVEAAKSEGKEWGITDTAEELCQILDLKHRTIQMQLSDALLIAPFLEDKAFDNCRSINEAKKLVLNKFEGDFTYEIEKKKAGHEIQEEENGETESPLEENQKSKRPAPEPPEKREIDPKDLHLERLRKFLERRASIHHGDFREIHREGKIPANTFDMILADPPYGINAQDFGTAAQNVHDYIDTPENALEICEDIFKLGYNDWTRDSAYIFMFCDISLYWKLYEMASDIGWRCMRTPIIWQHPNRGHIPFGNKHWKRSYDLILYGDKSNAPLRSLTSDIINIAIPENETSHAAKKPSNLYKELIHLAPTLTSSVVNGSFNVIDPTCGAGTIFEISGILYDCIEITGIEIDEEYYKQALVTRNNAIQADMDFEEKHYEQKKEFGALRRW